MKSIISFTSIGSTVPIATSINGDFYFAIASTVDIDINDPILSGNSISFLNY